MIGAIITMGFGQSTKYVITLGYSSLYVETSALTGCFVAKAVYESGFVEGQVSCEAC